MKILLINYEYPPNGGGAGNATREIGRALTQMGHAVTVLTGGRNNTEDGQDGIEIVRVGPSRRYVFQTGLLYMSAYAFSGTLWVLRQKKKRFDLSIVFFVLPCGPVATALKIRAKTPYVVSLRGGDVPGLVPEIDLLHRVLEPVRRWVGKNAKAVVANSRSLAKLAEASDAVSVTVVPNGVDTQYYEPGENGIGVEPAPLKLLIACRFQRQKLVPETIRWLAKAKHQGIDLLVSIVGDGPECDAVKAVIKEVDMTEFISLKGWLPKDQLLKQYQDADCFINLSSYEGMPNTVMEAMSCGLPVIASDIAPHQEIIADMISGFLIGLDCRNEFIRSLKKLDTDRRLVEKMGSAARERSLQNHSWLLVGKRYLSLGLQNR